MMFLTPLLTDYYQFTMAYGYWQLGHAEQEAVFQLTFRKNPFKGNYTVACGLATVIDFLKNYQFTTEHIAYLRSLKSFTNKQIFSEEFLNYLTNLKFTCDVEAIPEGTLVFPQEPLLRIKGPLLQCQLLETPLINLINFPTLVATRTTQICQLAQGDPVMEFGLRRAQGPNGGVTASRAAYLGGCESTSNVLAGQLFDIPVKGTMAHSWVMAFPDEYTAFLNFIRVADNTILLVDTFDTIEGVKNAIRIGLILRQEDRPLMAIRLDSGDLLTLSRRARHLLDDAGFVHTKIIASGDLSADKIAYLKKNKAPIDIWGVGTKLVTAYEQPALDVIYKLTALKENGQWLYKMKVSDAPEKMTSPGIQQVRRYYNNEQFIQDVIYDVAMGLTIKPPQQTDNSNDLLVPIFQQGKLIYQSPSLHDMRNFCRDQINTFIKSQKKSYLPKIDPKLQKVKNTILQQIR